MGAKKRLSFALAGQPNVGKSTVFNALTGLSQHVGNWPGKTVEKKIGTFTHQGTAIEMVDLPGTYSLSSSSEEERIARDYLIHDKPDAVIVLLNASSLERNLYLLAELLVLPLPIVVGLNMLDVAGQHGIRVDAHVLEAALGVPVIELVASRRKGLDELVDAAIRVVRDPGSYSPRKPMVREKHRSVLEQIEGLVSIDDLGGHPHDWLALKLLEGDGEAAQIVQEEAPELWDSVHEILSHHDDAYLDIAGGRYDWIARMVRAAVQKPKWGVSVVTDKIDRVAAHPFWGLVVLLAALAALFGVTYSVAGPAADFLSGLVSGPVSTGLHSILSWTPEWFSGVLVDGVIAGAGTVLSFLPILVVFFAALGLLEDVGYMARTAYVMDRYMHWMGLHGKSCMPLLLGFGCNVPAVLGTRIIDDRRGRLLTMMVTPFVPCAARLAVLTFLAPAFFGKAAPWALVALVGGNMVIVGIVGMVVNKFVFKGERAAFIMEMPLYHAPNARTVGIYVWKNSVSFLKKAGTLIVIFSGVIWILSSYPGANPGDSVLGVLGRALEPVGGLMGFGDWRLIVALISSFVAKENTIASLGVLLVGSGSAGAPLAARVAEIITPAAGAAFLVVQMTFVPCVATVAAIKHESKSWLFTMANLGLMLFVSLALGIIVYQVGSLLLS